MNELVIEPAIELPSSLDSSERWRIHGRLILRDEGMYFIHGWDEKGANAWRLLDAAIERLIRGSPEAHAGAQMLARYAHHSAPDQAEIVPRSRVVLNPDIASAAVYGLLPKLTIETQRHGDRLIYRVPRSVRAGVRTWAESR